VRVDFPPTAPDSFRVVGVRRGGHFVLRGRSDPKGGWSGPYAIRDLPLDEWPDGRASGLTGVLERGEGTVESRAGSLFVTGELAGRETKWAAAKFSRWTLAGVRGRLLPTPDLTAQAGANDGTFLGIHLDRASAPVTLGDQVVRFAPLTAQAGDTTIALSGQAAWHDAGWWMTVSAAEMSSTQFHSRPSLRCGCPVTRVACSSNSWPRTIAARTSRRAVAGRRRAARTTSSSPASAWTFPTWACRPNGVSGVARTFG
jgi:hypothetical protein